MPSLVREALGQSLLRSLQRKVLLAVLKVLFDYECRGQQNVPYTGPAVVASNHPSYLDGVLLSVKVKRPIRFMAWEKLFKVPIVGALLRSFGAFPVNPVRGKGGEAYEKAKALVAAGKVVGIFPEGRRSHSPGMEPTVRGGAARLSLETGAPLVPATITGAYRAWPYLRALPRPARIRVRFHEPIDPRAYAGMTEGEAVAEMLVEWRRRVDRSLKPGARADRRKVSLYTRPSPPPRFHELALPIVVSLVLFYRSLSWWYQAVPVAYVAYLFADAWFLPQRRRLKWLRNVSPLLLTLVFGPSVLEALRLPEIAAGRALCALLAGSVLPYFYERATIALGYLRGLVFAILLELLALHVAPSPFGPHVALPLFAGAYAWSQRTAFWRYALPFLTMYALGATWYMGGRPPMMIHVAAGVGAWLLTLLWPYRAERAAIAPQ
jgi:1-acyl-sn-glycerol-3-phosphate acyltransferase